MAASTTASTAGSTAGSTPASDGSADELAWVPAGDAYDLALDGGKIVCRNKKGKRLKSVPKVAKETEVGENLIALGDWLDRHDAECRAKVETWMLGSMPVPSDVVIAVWPDPSWRDQLRDAVIMPVDGDGVADDSAVGFLRDAVADRGIGIVNLDGETEWLDRPGVVIPHPVLLDELDDLREFAIELVVQQTIEQLMRDVHTRPDDLDATATSINTFAGAKFEQLRHATGRAGSLGFRVRGGYAACRAFDAGVPAEARYWLGADDPNFEAYTGELVWVDGDEQSMPVGTVGPVAFSEGTRMASLIHAGRVVDDGEATG